MTFVEGIISLVLSLGLTVLFLPQFINYAHRKKQGQMIREEGPSWHQKKSGTPTMGGLIFNSVILVVSLVCGLIWQQLSAKLLVLLFILVLYAGLGFWDDSIKLWKKQNEGLKAWQKLLGQIIGAIVFMAVYYHEKLPLSLHLFGYEISIGVFFIIFAIFWLVGFSNAVNLTDGIDGLVAGQATIAFTVYAIIAAHQQQFDILLFCLAIIGALLGFLIFNHKPAKIFMGDMGSLALGGALAAVSMLVNHEISLLWIGLIFVIETASVILQVASFKLTGKRIFKMSPIHHHFELCGWSEWRIDLTFWFVGIITGVSALLTIF
ncbi:MAG: phospho-N-acetylmuramoyl-pentapeptide-transferase [Liquorilactobacillus nagelii]|jgi:phospho-N-acetylmuramoyl-pentapeptide-transferase|uniref:Phospho-N-acetylmuramoyl-pentapeptide-transferase n=1 Tax=Liquorilactobacillus nagelii TaxID=82688 RepID=A0A3Q8CFE7_9LACO|nr:phospho-N-acetylmuramoyl-pentapeptide-transferase [Liquorilactobacillus nagelii]AUJ32347.1 phospho-N-acetylmuramoyl-pentapeptide-transferase [Liquorilactobacillus nagelii]MCC7615529.1 phospho-N-acetylmuramoyl-pentapeptide-transferase [Liquorilactobacillus nagelii]MCI1920383.1 phospho-N-acetylmuramoyl-pentapeptide-transferase [Liquorilactobacillus nagelii]MCI1976027.1 phospho-N-acetylmuramoyl-pentapeptide-transferase [Liquorilactobacillus nagelii]MCP9314599.1 phospho-N-acetylmuramoyl-pentape